MQQQDKEKLEFFKLVRPVDPIGISGTGEVAFGLELLSGDVFLSWNNTAGKTCHWFTNLEEMKGIHCHSGTTVEKIGDKDSDYSVQIMQLLKAVGDMAVVGSCFISRLLLYSIDVVNEANAFAEQEQEREDD